MLPKFCGEGKLTEHDVARLQFKVIGVVYVPTGQAAPEMENVSPAGIELIVTGVVSDCTAPRAITIPKPESRSTPGAMMSRAEALRAVWICEAFSDGRADFTSAAIAAACGAAADVPQNGLLNPGVLEGVQSAAAKSGFCSNVPPLVEKSRFPGVIGVPVGL